MKNRQANAAVKNIPVTKDTITKWLKQDVQNIYSLSYELLQTPEALDLIADRLYQRFLKQQAEAELSASNPSDDANV